MRQEALPLFYSCCEFDFFTYERQDGCCRIDVHGRDFIKHTSAAHFGRIRVVSISFGSENLEHNCSTTIKIYINGNNYAAKISRFSLFDYLNRGKSPEIRHKFKSLLKLEPLALIQGIAARERRPKLRKKDIRVLHDSLYGALQAALKDASLVRA